MDEKNSYSFQESGVDSSPTNETPVFNGKCFDAVVISGGGIKGILALGALQYFYEKGEFDLTKTSIHIGTSIGFVINLLSVCGYTPMEMFMEIYKKDNFINAADFSSISDIYNHMGLIPIRIIMKDVEKMVLKKFENNQLDSSTDDIRKQGIPTFQELKEKTGKTLIAVATNVTKVRPEYYDHNTSPDLSVIDAAKMSCNLPPVFQRIKYKGNYIVDGAFMDNFPLNHIDDGKMKVLAIVTRGSNFPESELGFAAYFYRLAVSASAANMELRCKLVGENTTLIKIEWDTSQDNPSDVLRLSMSQQEKMEMFLRGYKCSEFRDKTECLYVEGWTDII